MRVKLSVLFCLFNKPSSICVSVDVFSGKKFFPEKTGTTLLEHWVTSIYIAAKLWSSLALLPSVVVLLVSTAHPLVAFESTIFRTASHLRDHWTLLICFFCVYDDALFIFFSALNCSTDCEALPSYSFWSKLSVGMSRVWSVNRKPKRKCCNNYQQQRFCNG